MRTYKRFLEENGQSKGHQALQIQENAEKTIGLGHKYWNVQADTRAMYMPWVHSTVVTRFILFDIFTKCKESFVHFFLMSFLVAFKYFFNKDILHRTLLAHA